MHKYHKFTTGGGLELLEPSTLHKRGVHDEGHDERGASRRRRAEGNSRRHRNYICGKSGNYVASAVRSTSYKLLYNGRRLDSFRGILGVQRECSWGARNRKCELGRKNILLKHRLQTVPIYSPRLTEAST